MKNTAFGAGYVGLVIATGQRTFRSSDFGFLPTTLQDGVIFDGRNLCDPDRLAWEGLTCSGIGVGCQSMVSGGVAG